MRKTNAKGSTKAEAPGGWRAQVFELVKRALDVLRDEDEDLQSMTMEGENGCFAFELIFGARRLLESNAGMLWTGSAGDYYGDVIVPALAMVLGAQGMKDTHRALPAMLEPAVAALTEAEEITPAERADNAGSALPPAAAPIASPGPDTKAGEPSGTSELLEWHPVSTGMLPAPDDDVLVELETGDDDRVFEGYQEEGQWFVGDDPVRVEVIAWAKKPGGTRRSGRPSAATSPAGEASEEDDPDAWRREVVNALEKVSRLQVDAVKVAQEGSFCWRLLKIAEYKHLQFLPDFDDEGILEDECFDLEALFRGAAALSDAPLGVKLICERAAGLMDKATDVIDRAGIAAAHAKGADHA